MKLFDTHAHLLDEAFDPDRDAVIASLPGQGVAHVMECCCDEAGEAVDKAAEAVKDAAEAAVDAVADAAEKVVEEVKDCCCRKDD